VVNGASLPLVDADSRVGLRPGAGHVLRVPAPGRPGPPHTTLGVAALRAAHAPLLEALERGAFFLELAAERAPAHAEPLRDVIDLRASGLELLHDVRARGVDQGRRHPLSRVAIAQVAHEQLVQLGIRVPQRARERGLRKRERALALVEAQPRALEHALVRAQVRGPGIRQPDLAVGRLATHPAPVAQVHHAEREVGDRPAGEVDRLLDRDTQPPVLAAVLEARCVVEHEVVTVQELERVAGGGAGPRRVLEVAVVAADRLERGHQAEVLVARHLDRDAQQRHRSAGQDPGVGIRVLQKADRLRVETFAPHRLDEGLNQAHRHRVFGHGLGSGYHTPGIQGPGGRTEDVVMCGVESMARDLIVSAFWPPIDSPPASFREVLSFAAMSHLCCRQSPPADNFGPWSQGRTQWTT
jgi:hypothetical protein